MARSEHILDELLVLRCRQGSSEAFRQLVKRWQKRLWHHAYRLTGREDAAWDVLQEAWIAVTKGITDLADPTRFRRWAYAIVTRRAADWQRRRSREERTSTLAEDAPAQEPDLDTAATVSLVRQALRKLDGPRRALLSLRYLEGFDVWEMAEILDIPEGTVKSRLYHARQQLKEIIERMEREVER